jgi:hypothetical protein
MQVGNRQVCEMTRFNAWLGDCDGGGTVAKLGQFADVHDSFAELLRTMDRRVLIGWIAAAAQLELRGIGEIRERSTTIAALGFLRPARKGVADVVLTVHDRHERVVLGLILEVQLSLDWTKRWNWPFLATALAAEIRRMALVVVLTPDPQRRDAIRRRLLPKMEPRPLLIEPDQIPLIDDAERARREPRETIFAALYHARETRESIGSRVAGIRAAVIAIRTLDRQEQLRYGALMRSFTPMEIMQRALEELRNSGALDEPDPDQFVFYPDSYAAVYGLQKGRELMLSPSTLRILEHGEELGREEGRQEGRATLRRVIFDVLEARGLTLSSATRARIETCEDTVALTRWCTRAALVGSSDELFEAG